MEGAPATTPLAADCDRCAALCCVVLPLSRGREFPRAKAAGEVCTHLDPDLRCRIHANLRLGGWLGCVEFDCFGAGQQLTQVGYGGRVSEPAELVAEAFAALRALHELRFLLQDPACGASSYAGDAAALDAELAGLAEAPAGVLRTVPVAELRERTGGLLGRVAAEVGGPRHRGALLIRADLRGADLTGADLLGADLRDADLRGADLAGALFLTQPQVTAAHGDRSTRLPARLRRPRHWPSQQVNKR